MWCSWNIHVLQYIVIISDMFVLRAELTLINNKFIKFVQCGPMCYRIFVVCRSQIWYWTLMVWLVLQWLTCCATVAASPGQCLIFTVTFCVTVLCHLSCHYCEPSTTHYVRTQWTIKKCEILFLTITLANVYRFL